VRGFVPVELAVADVEVLVDPAVDVSGVDDRPLRTVRVGDVDMVEPAAGENRLTGPWICRVWVTKPRPGASPLMVMAGSILR